MPRPTRLRSLALAALACIAAAPSVLGGAAHAAAPPAPPTPPFPAPTGIALLDVRYGPAPDHVLDVHAPAPAAGSRPALLLIHGGGWFAGDKSRLTPLARALAARGFVVFNANYTLAAPGRPGFPTQVTDVRAALAWTAANAARYGGDRRRIGVLGTSAGGTLAALLALSAPPRPVRRAPVRSLVTWSAPFDLTTLPPGQLRQLAAIFTGCRRASCPQRAAASPLRHLTPAAPPTLIVNGRRELVPLRQARRMAAALAASGVPQRLVVIPGALHGRELAPHALGPTVAFLRRWL